MNCFEETVQQSYDEGFIVVENLIFESNSEALIKNKKIGLSHKLETNVAKHCALCEELAHYKYNVGNILDQAVTENRKQERKARLWAYKKMVTMSKLLDAYKCGCQCCYEIAEHLDVTEDILKEAIDTYREIYGICHQKDNIVIFFESALNIYELI